MREGDRCDCDDGWEGINCNMCTDDRACDSLMESNEGGVCYKMGNLLKNNYQMCDVTNEKIRDLLGEQIPQVTFTCDASNGRCDFQCMFFSLCSRTLHALTMYSLGRSRRVVLL